MGFAASKNVGGKTPPGNPRYARPGRIQSLYDFCESIESALTQQARFRKLIKSGAMDSSAPEGCLTPG